MVAIGNAVGVIRYLSLAGSEGTFPGIATGRGAPDESDADRWVVDEDGVRRPRVDRVAGSASVTEVIRRATENVNSNRSTIGNYAGFWNRFGALALDLALVEIALFFALLTSLLVGNWDRDAWNQAVAEYGDSILYVMLLLYYTIMEGSTKRATIGKLVYGIAVMDENGERLVWWRAALRNLFKILSVMTLFVGFLLVGLTQKKQALHDLITRSFVVKESRLEL